MRRFAPFSDPARSKVTAALRSPAVYSKFDMVAPVSAEPVVSYPA